MSILTACMGINITCISYADGVDFGIIVDPDQVPDHHTLADRLQDALSEYIALSKPARKKRRPAAKAKKKAVQKRTPRTKASAKTRAGTKTAGTAAKKAALKNKSKSKSSPTK